MQIRGTYGDRGTDTSGMTETTAPTVQLPRQRGSVTIRAGGLHEDLDALHEGDPLWWGKDFVADRVRSIPPGTPHLMLIGELDGVPVADAFHIGKGAAQNGYALSGIYVLPHARGRGVGRALADLLSEASASHGLPGTADNVHELDETSMVAARRLGYEVLGHHRESVLDLDALDEDVARAAVDRAVRAGFELRPLPLDADEDDWHQVYDVAVETWADAPDAEGSTEPIPYSVFRGFLPDPSYVLLAHRDGRPVGMTCVMDRAKDDALNTFFTGVSRDARGAGLSTALKARHALDMKARGHHRLYTQNMDQNVPILAANDRLGFTVEPGYYAVGRPVAPPAG
jgi:GNAT superfamily N-acetyltransferase